MIPFVLLVLFICLPIISGQPGCPPTVGPCFVFPPQDEINRPIDTDPVDAFSPCIVAAISEWGTNIRLDLGTDVSEGYGMPFTIATTSQPLLPLTYGTDGTDYQSQSDWYTPEGAIAHGPTISPGTMPWPQDAAIEGWLGSPETDPTSGDRHIIVVDQSTCMLSESWNSIRLNPGFEVTNTAIFNMSKVITGQRPNNWTSADAAGLPIYPLILKYPEIASGAINHALRFTATNAQMAYTNPATHFGSGKNVSYPYYGARFRLKASFDISSYSTDGQTLLTALKKYGIIFADQGSTAFITGTSDPGFTDLLPEINTNKPIPFSEFEMVQSPNPVIRGYTPTDNTCNGVGPNPPFTPVWTPPVCYPPTPSPTTAPIPIAPPSNQTNLEDDLGLQIGVAIAGAFVLIVVIICIIFFAHKSTKAKRSSSKGLVYDDKKFEYV